MHARFALIASLAVVILGVGCSALTPAQPPTPTLFVLPTLPPTAQPPAPLTEAAPATEAAPPTANVSLPDVPTPTIEVGQPTFPTPTPRVQSGGTVDRVQIYLIALQDDGKSGDKVGCGDSVVPVERQITPTQAPLRAAFDELLSVKDQFYGQSGLYNALYTSNLTVSSVSIDANGTALIALAGTFSLAGECDDPRFEAQLVYTAKQFVTVKDAQITINDKPLKDLLGGK